jgi:LysR family transcriptional activator of dmlA
MDHLETIRAFVKVAETSSFSRTAEHMSVTTAVITRHIAALESRLNARLFQRTTRHVSLTDAGRMFLERARRILEDLEDAENLVSTQQRQPGGVLRIASPVAFGLRHLSLILKSFTESHPMVTPHITLSDDAINLVEQQFDVAIVPEGDMYSNTLVMRRFASSPLQLVASPDYVAKRGHPKSMSELNQHVFLSHSGKRLNQGQQFLEQVGRICFEAETQIVANSLEMIHRLSVDGHGIAALPEYLVGTDIDNGLLVNILPDVEMPTLNMNIAFETRHNMHAKVRAFVDFIVDHFGITGIKKAFESNPAIAERSAELARRKLDTPTGD